MWPFNRRRHLENKVDEVKVKVDETARELSLVKKRQLEIERRLELLKQELEVQIRNV